MSLVIKLNPSTIGPIVAMKTAENSSSNKQKWISKNKNSNSYGDNTFQSKIKTTFKNKVRLLKFSKKYIQSNTTEEA